MNPNGESKANTAAKHTYDVGYERWNNIDYEKELGSVDTQKIESIERQKAANEALGGSRTEREEGTRGTKGKKAGVDDKGSENGGGKSQAGVGKPCDEVERELGNQYFAKKEWNDAVRSYTRAIGFNPKSAAAYSNRAIAYIKLEKFEEAEKDCCAALEIDISHVKTLLRRASARNALGRHKAALLDVLRACKLQPKNSQALKLRKETENFILESARRAPTRKVPITGIPQREAPGQASPVSAAKEFSESFLEPSKKTKDENNKVDRGDLNFGVGRGDRRELLKSPHTENRAAALRATRLVTKSSILEKPVKTLYEFERVWKELEYDIGQRAQLLLLKLGKTKIEKLFSKVAPEPELFLSIIACLDYSLNNKDSVSFSIGEVGERVLEVLYCISLVKGMDLTILFLTKEDKVKVRNILDLCSTSSGKHDEMKKTLRRLF